MPSLALPAGNGSAGYRMRVPRRRPRSTGDATPAPSPLMIYGCDDPARGRRGRAPADGRTGRTRSGRRVGSGRLRLRRARDDVRSRFYPPLPAALLTVRLRAIGTQCRARERLGQGDLGHDRQVGAACLPPARRGPTEERLAEEGGEHVGEIAEVEGARRVAPAPKACCSVLVVQLARPRSERKSYASTSSRKRSAAFGASETSGCNSRASLRNARLISASLAPGRCRGSRSSRARSSPRLGYAPNGYVSS